MPRQPRIDLPGLLQHVIVRGIERTEIFLDDVDRQRFVDRFSHLLVETGTDCYAWALIPNHFHLLLRCNNVELSSFMRRLLTAYAIYFNRRHNRSGHLFQNRYKSIVCEEEPYFLELVRYIHLNPLRAGLLAEFDKLDDDPWCGHAVIMGRRSFSGQSVADVLERFSNKVNTSRRHYRQFVADGLVMGKKAVTITRGPELNEVAEPAAEVSVASDERVLGSGEFLNTVLKADTLRGCLSPPMTLGELQKEVADYFNVKPDALGARGRQNESSFARALFCCLAVKKLQYTGVEVGRMLGIGGSSVSRAIRRGEELFLSREDLQVWWEGILKQ